jgi:hypothetical protein
MASRISETLEVEADTSDPFVPGLFWSWVGKATVRLKFGRPSKRAGARCKRCIVSERDMRMQSYQWIQKGVPELGVGIDSRIDTIEDGDAEEEGRRNRSRIEIVIFSWFLPLTR